MHRSCRETTMMAGIAIDSVNYVRTVQTETEAALSVLEGGGQLFWPTVFRRPI